MLGKFFSKDPLSEFKKTTNTAINNLEKDSTLLRLLTFHGDDLESISSNPLIVGAKENIFTTLADFNTDNEESRENIILTRFLEDAPSEHIEEITTLITNNIDSHLDISQVQQRDPQNKKELFNLLKQHNNSLNKFLYHLSFVHNDKIEFGLNNLLNNYFSKITIGTNKIIENENFFPFKYKIIYDIKEQAKFYSIITLGGLDKFYTSKKIRAKYALTYIGELEDEEKNNSSDTTTGSTNNYVRWKMQNGPIIEKIITNVLVDHHGKISSGFDNSKKNNINQEKKELLKARCQSVLDKNYTLEYSFGKQLVE